MALPRDLREGEVGDGRAEFGVEAPGSAVADCDPWPEGTVSPKLCVDWLGETGD
jgi:hypothetical protein